MFLTGNYMLNNYKRLLPWVLNISPFNSFFGKQNTQLAAPEISSNTYNNVNKFTSMYLLPNKLEVAHLVSYPKLNFTVRTIKRLFDIFFSIIVITAGLPIFIMLFLITKFSSPGPAIYKQERIGKDECPFFIYKFRSMYIGAEKYGPQLSSKSDPRITKWGRIIRSTRLDELPQFWNVLKGEMSVVGPRPERRYFIERIVEKNSNYKKLQKLKPGITSMGQVYFGYAENVDEMCERMLFDLRYIQKVNLYTDLTVIAKTLKVMVQRKGK